MSQILSNLRRNPTAALLAAAGIFALIAVFDIAAHPASQHALRTYKEYVLTATIFPAAVAVLWALSALTELHRRQTRLARAGLRVVAVALAALVADGAVTLASANTDTAGPLYPIAMLGIVVGMVLLAIDWYRARLLPRWVGPTLAVGWFIGATPISGSVGAFLVPAVAFAAAAAALRRQASTRPLGAPAEVEIAL
jgi:hypothetical protein